MQSGTVDRIHLRDEREWVWGVPSKSLILRVFRVLRIFRGNSHCRFQV